MIYSRASRRWITHGCSGCGTSSPRSIASGIKVYLRRPAEDLPLVKRICDEAFGPMRRIAYLHADVCRAELLVEIEGVVVLDSGLHAEAPWFR